MRQSDKKTLAFEYEFSLTHLEQRPPGWLLINNCGHNFTHFMIGKMLCPFSWPERGSTAR